MTNLFYRSVSGEQMALAAAMSGNVALFRAVMAHTKVDPKALSIFTSVSNNYHPGIKFYLLYELVRLGHYDMFKLLVEKHDLSPFVLEEQAELYAARQAEVKESNDSISRALYIDDTYWHNGNRCRYFVSSILAFVDQLMVDYEEMSEQESKRIKAIRNRQREFEKKIKGRQVSPERFAAYVERWQRYMQLGSGQKKSPRRIELYENILTRDACAREIEKQTEELAALRVKIAEAGQFRIYLEALLAKRNMSKKLTESN